MREWWRDAVIYQIYPRSFQDSDGDGIGDLRGITDRLPHVAELGADAIWLSPIFTSPMKDMGYDVSDYTDIDPLFGTLADFDALIARAHELGLKVIVDQVLSHSSDQHPHFQESRSSRENDKANWYVWADPKPDGSPPNNWHSHFGGPAWEHEPRRGQYYLHNFLASQPDLNFHDEEVQDWLLSTCRFWLERGVDGFRLDTVNYFTHDPMLRDNPPADVAGAQMATDLYGMQMHLFDKTRPENVRFLEKMRALTDEFPDRMMVGEVGEAGDRAIEIMADYTRGTDRLHMCYSFEMLGPTFTAAHFRNVISRFQAGAPDGHPKWSFSNHDVVRHVSRWLPHAVDQDAIARQACAMLMSFEGTIGIYQGEELGLTETELEYSELTDPPALRFWPQVRGRDGCRTPMPWSAQAEHGGFTTGTPWLPVKDPQHARAVDAQGGDPTARNGTLAFYRAMIAQRKSSADLSSGATRFHDLPEPILAFDRGATLCVFNLSKEPVEVTVADGAALAEASQAQVEGTTLSLPPNGYAWLTGAGVPRG
ncbi:MAG: alpha-glucosidase [Paracoccaceae bacterium]